MGMATGKRDGLVVALNELPDISANNPGGFHGTDGNGTGMVRRRVREPVAK
jgi:hypothetical protein